MPRARRPVEGRILDGSYKPSRHGPLPDTSDMPIPPVKPVGLKGDAARFWDELIATVGKYSRDSDGMMLAVLSELCSERARVWAALRKTKPGAKGYNQLLVALGICTDKVDKIASRFGLTPSDRAKLRAEQVGPVKAKVATRPRTKLDRAGGPK